MGKVKLRKVKSLLDTPHPNGIENGFTYVGLVGELPKIGKSLHFSDGFRTSKVTEVGVIVPGVGGTHKFETKNSVYYMTFLD